MRKIILSLLSALMLVGCATTAENGVKMTKAEKRAHQIAKVKEMLDNRYYSVDIHMMYPQTYPSKQVEYGYALTIHGDSILSYLPYIGRAYRIPYGGGKGLHFEALIDDYREENVKNDLRRIEILTHNEEDRYLYILEVFSTGSASIYVSCENREHIHYSGEIDIDHNPQPNNKFR